LTHLKPLLTEPRRSPSARQHRHLLRFSLPTRISGSFCS